MKQSIRELLDNYEEDCYIPTHQKFKKKCRELKKDGQEKKMKS